MAASTTHIRVGSTDSAMRRLEFAQDRASPLTQSAGASGPKCEEICVSASLVDYGGSHPHLVQPRE